MILKFYRVIKIDIFTNMTIILDMKSPKCPYKLNIIIFEYVGPTFNNKKCPSLPLHLQGVTNIAIFDY